MEIPFNVIQLRLVNIMSLKQREKIDQKRVLNDTAQGIDALRRGILLGGMGATAALALPLLAGAADLKATGAPASPRAKER